MAHGMGVPVEDPPLPFLFLKTVHIMYLYAPTTGLLPGMMVKDRENSL